MNYKYLDWDVVPGVSIPMMEDSTGELWGTNKTVAALLGITESGVRDIYSGNKKEFDKNCVGNSDAISFLKRHKSQFGLKYVRSDMALWSSEDILTFCYRASGDKAIEIRRKFSKFIKEHSKRNYVTQEQYLKLEEKFQAMATLVLQHLPAVESTASLAGRTLNMQKQTKPLRELLN